VRAPISQQLKDFLEFGDDVDVPFVAKLGASQALLKTRPVVAQYFDDLDVQRKLAGVVVELDHVGFSAGGRSANDAFVHYGAKLLGFEVTRVFPSCQALDRKMVRLESPDGNVEAAIDSRNHLFPHLAWRVTDRRALMDVGDVLEGTGFRAPDFLRNCVLFNRDEDVMFRYFNGRFGEHPIAMEFLW
jgi:hypothetical protein